MRKEKVSKESLYQKADTLLAMLDEQVKAPDSLVASILDRKEELELPKVRRLNMMSMIQIAAAILFGIFIGHQFGKLANIPEGKSKQNQINQYFKAHHFDVGDDAIKSNPLYTIN